MAWSYLPLHTICPVGRTHWTPGYVLGMPGLETPGPGCVSSVTTHTFLTKADQFDLVARLGQHSMALGGMTGCAFWPVVASKGFSSSFDHFASRSSPAMAAKAAANTARLAVTVSSSSLTSISSLSAKTLLLMRL
jgi:hypothetical protein